LGNDKATGRRKISELNDIIDATELNEFLRMVFNDEHPTIYSNCKIRPADYMIETCRSTGNKTIKACKEVGLSFCRTLSQFVDVAKLKTERAKQKMQVIHIYKIKEDAQLPQGLAFNKDRPGHVSLIATKDMSWNEMINKLKLVSDMLEHFTTLRVEL
jgi:hypothetical protein